MSLGDKAAQEAAATQLEELVPAIKDAVKLLRMEVAPQLAYALVYTLRRELGYVARTLGAGVPPADYQHQANDIIDSATWLGGVRRRNGEPEL